LALLSTATLAVRGAMEQRRGRAEQAWREASVCVLVALESAPSARTNELRLCSRSAADAAQFALEMPEHGERQWELQAALDELVRALESGDEHRLSDAIARSSRAGSALGWHVRDPRLR
jgi:hypothetical protein